MQSRSDKTSRPQGNAIGESGKFWTGWERRFQNQDGKTKAEAEAKGGKVEAYTLFNNRAGRSYLVVGGAFNGMEQSQCDEKRSTPDRECIIMMILELTLPTTIETTLLYAPFQPL